MSVISIYMDLIQLFFGVVSNPQINPGRLNATELEFGFLGALGKERGNIYVSGYSLTKAHTLQIQICAYT